MAGALFDTACAWAARGAPRSASGPACFTTNDELGLLVDGFDDPPALLTLQNPRYYESLWVEHGWEQAMDLWAWHFDAGHHRAVGAAAADPRPHPAAGPRCAVRGIRMDDFDAEVGRFFEVYNAAWSDNWGFAPMPEAEIRHLAKQLKQIINPNWAFGLETPDGQVVGVCLALPDVNQLMRRVRSGRLLPFGWYPLLTGRAEARPRPGLGPRRPARLPAPGPRARCCTGRSSTGWRRIPTSAPPRRRGPWPPTTASTTSWRPWAPTARRCGASTSARPAARPAAPTAAATQARRSSAGARAASKPSRARSMSRSLWVAITEVRSMARGTAGGMAQLV